MRWSSPSWSPSDWARRRPDLAAVLALVAITTVLFAPTLLSGRTLSPMNILAERAPWHTVIAPVPPPNAALTDIAQVFHPWLLYAGRQIRSGVVPLWNPHEYTGAPFFGNGQSALLFPVTMLAFVLPPAAAVTVISWVKLLSIGLATYWFVRILGPSPWPASIAAIGFMLSAPVIGWLQWTFASTFICLPLLLGAIERLRRRDDRPALVLVAAVVTLDVLAGYPQSAAQALVVASGWALALAARDGGAIGFLARYAAAVALGLALAAVQLVPFVEYVRESFVLVYRSQWTPIFWAPLRSAATFLMPYYYGAGKESWGVWQFAVQTGYAGIVTLAVLPLGVRAALRRADGRFFVGLAAVCLALHYGLPGVSLAAEVPGFSLGTNLRLMPLIAFALCVLAALGLETLRAERPDRVAARLVGGWFTAVAVLALVVTAQDHARAAAQKMVLSLQAQYAIALLGLTVAALVVGRVLTASLAPARGLVALALVQLASLAPMAATYNPSVERGAFFPTTPAIEYLRREAGHQSRVLMSGTVALAYGLFEAQGYDGMSPRRLVEITGVPGTGSALARGFLQNTVALHGSEPLSAIRILVSPVLDLLGVRYVLLAPGAAPPRPGFVQVYDAPDARIFRNDAAVPRAMLVAHARCVDDAEALAAIRSRALDPRREVLLAGCATPPAGDDPAAAGPGGSAAIDDETANRVTVRVSTERPAYLVLSDTWFPGWEATVDGRPARVWRANHTLRAVALPPGAREVVFSYAPRSLRIGAIVSLAALGVAAVAMIPGWPRRPRAPVKAVVTAAVLAGAAAPASAALPAPPFDFGMSPGAVTEGAPVTIRIAPVHAAGAGVPEAYDLYLALARTDEASFLTEDGAWSPTPVPYARAVGVSAPPIVRQWPRAWPPGEHAFALVVVPVSGDPLARSAWRYRPVIRWVDVEPRVSDDAAPDYATLAILAVATLGAIAAVWWSTLASRRAAG
jgi:hypothetical protein